MKMTSESPYGKPQVSSGQALGQYLSQISRCHPRPVMKMECNRQAAATGTCDAVIAGRALFAKMCQLSPCNVPVVAVCWMWLVMHPATAAMRDLYCLAIVPLQSASPLRAWGPCMRAGLSDSLHELAWAVCRATRLPDPSWSFGSHFPECLLSRSQPSCWRLLRMHCPLACHEVVIKVSYGK